MPHAFEININGPANDLADVNARLERGRFQAFEPFLGQKEIGAFHVRDLTHTKHTMQ